MSIEINTDTMPVRNMEKRNTALCEMSGALALLIILHYEYTFEKEGFSRPSPYGRDKSAPTEGWCLEKGRFSRVGGADQSSCHCHRCWPVDMLVAAHKADNTTAPALFVAIDAS